ncbi:MAG: tetratricopeptide repeat protein [Flavobacteriales bacterium]
MAKQNKPEVDPMLNVEEALTGTEKFIEKNKKMLGGIVGGVIIIILLFMSYNKFIAGPKEIKAQEAMFQAEFLFEKDSFNLALNGDGETLGFLQILEEFGSTKSGNLANYYAGICFMQLGQYEEAVKHFDSYSGKDIILSSMALGLKGDALIELGKTEEAANAYTKAAGRNENQFTSPMYLLKAGFAFEELNNFEKAREAYQKIRKDFFTSAESRDAERHLARIEAILSSK